MEMRWADSDWKEQYEMYLAKYYRMLSMEGMSGACMPAQKGQAKRLGCSVQQQEDENTR